MILQVKIQNVIKLLRFWLERNKNGVGKEEHKLFTKH